MTNELTPSDLAHSVDDHFMQLALQQAVQAYEANEVPIGAIIVNAEGDLIGRAWNQTETLKDGTAHAEMIALTQAASALGDWRLNGCCLYVTKEPCPMCAGALIQTRISRVVWGVTDLKGGGHSRFDILDHPNLNHRVDAVPGVAEEACLALLQEFFQARRKR